MSNKKMDIPVILLAAGEEKRLQTLSNQIIKPIIPIAEKSITDRIIQYFYDNGFNQFIVIINAEDDPIKDTIDELELVKSKKISVEFVFQNNPDELADTILKMDNLILSRFKEGKLNFEGEYPTMIEPVVSDGKVVLGDSVLLGPNVFIGKDCKIDNLVEISNSILMGNNIIGKSTIIENSIIGPNVIIEENQKLSNALIIEELEENK